MKAVMAFQRDHDPKIIDLPLEFLTMTGIQYITTNDDIYTVTHIEFNLSENILYFWVK